MKAFKTTADLPLERRIKAALGRALATANPELAARVREKPFTQELKPHERLLRNARQHQAIAEKDHETLRQFLVDYWSSPFSNEFFVQFADRFEELFLRYHTEIVDELSRELDKVTSELPIHLIELGCGDGKVLQYLKEHLTQPTRFTGLDLSADEIANCSERYRETPELVFHTTEITDFLSAQPPERLLLFTNGGVLEYFTREQLVALFSLVRELSPTSLISLTETLATDHDLENEPESYPYGRELAFSHNYRALLRECGFEISWTNDRFTKEGEENHPTRWLQIIASSPALNL